MPRKAYVVGTFDTKSEELLYVAGLLRGADLEVVTVDVGTRSPSSAADIPARAVAACHPDGEDAVLSAGDRGQAVTAMAEALGRFAAGLDDVGGIIGLGGSGGTTLVTSAMRALPIGVPKLMVSTVASGDTAGYVGISDITMMFPVTDIAGLNRLSRTILANAANALAGMMKGDVPKVTDARPSLGVSMFGVTTPCVQKLTAALDVEFDCQVFHANGPGGRAFEALTEAGMLAGMIDLTTTEAADHLFGGVCSAGPHRFEAMAKTGVPWIGSCGALDMVNFGPRETVPERYADRLFHVHNANVTLMRTTPDENEQIALWLAEKLNRATGPVHLLIPERGVSMLDAEGEVFHDPAADKVLFDTLERSLVQTETRRVHRVPHHINDDGFVAAAIPIIRSVMSLPHSQKPS